MDKLAGKIIDFNDDPRFVTDLRAQGLYGHELVDPKSLDKLPDSAFAIKLASGGRTHRRFPIHNRVATQLSAAYFAAGVESGDLAKLGSAAAAAVGYRIGQACERFGLEAPSACAGLEDPGSIEVDVDDIPLDEPKMATAEARGYLEQRVASGFVEMGPEARTFAVQSLVKAAGVDAVTRKDLWDYFPKAHLGPDFEEGMHAREVLVKRAEGNHSDLSSSMFDALMEDLRSVDPREAPTLLGTFDKVAGLTDRYKDGLPDPYQTCWGGFSLPKEARARFDGSVDALLAPEQERGTPEEYLVDLEKRYPTHDVNFPKLAAVASATVDDRPWPDNYKKAIRRHFA